jgi:hypothetical protein
MNTEQSVKTFMKDHLPSGLVRAMRAVRYRRTPIKTIFTELYYEPARDWEVISGPGSDRTQTQVIAREIPRLAAELEINVFLDAPCGDFFWMRHVALPVERYIGVDIVDALIQGHRDEFTSPEREFRCLDLSADELPKADMIHSRDLLVHLSHRDALQVLANFKRSGARYLLTTTFPGTKKNEDIVTGGWRPLNLELPPFNFQPPVRLINEGCTEDNHRYADKSLGLWRLDRLKIER